MYIYMCVCRGALSPQRIWHLHLGLQPMICSLKVSCFTELCMWCNTLYTSIYNIYIILQKHWKCLKSAFCYQHKTLFSDNYSNDSIENCFNDYKLNSNHKTIIFANNELAAKKLAKFANISTEYYRAYFNHHFWYKLCPSPQKSKLPEFYM